MTYKAIILIDAAEVTDSDRLAELLAWFGVSEDRMTVSGLLAVNTDAVTSKFRLFSSARAFLKLTEALERSEAARQFWDTYVHSVFLHAGDGAAAVERLAGQLTGNAQASLIQVKHDNTWVISDKFPDFCKAMGGVRVPASAKKLETALDLGYPRLSGGGIISCEAGVGLVKLEFREVSVFLSSASSVIDINAQLVLPSFDIRREFLSAAPVVMYIKWAFDRTCWHAHRTSACLVIDDPPLKPRYGFLDFAHLVRLMREHGFSTDIAFIPRNWRRSNARVVRLFHENPERLSLSVHGCDHTGGEFGIRNSGRLAWRSKRALRLMARHEARTGIRFAPVMVFPQGVFSETAMGVLKRCNFVGAANSDVVSADPKPNSVRVRDYWDVAVMTSSSFPIFSRRYPSDGVENFAFDILLGKPCIVVIHHNDCHDRCRPLMEFLDQLNSLPVMLSWCGLGETVRRSFRQRQLSPGGLEVEMYGSEVIVENSSGERVCVHVRKQETQASSIDWIRAGPRLVDWTAAEGHIAFQFELGPGEFKAVRIAFVEIPENSIQKENLQYKARALVRRYLSEVRDNYLARRPFSS